MIVKRERWLKLLKPGLKFDFHLSYCRTRMERANYALEVIAHDLRNAGARQRSRLKREDTQSLAVDAILHELRKSMKALRKNVKRLEQLENRERAAKLLDKPAVNKLAGVNRKLTGTFGR